MKTDITAALVREHKLILRMVDLLAKNAQLTAAGNYRNYKFYLDGVAFIREYADRFHHAKEEDILFEALVKNGMPRENSPVAAMLMEHDQGRAYVKGMEQAATAALEGARDQDGNIAANALGYVNLLQEHIAKEDDILYPLAERIIPEEMRAGILAGYREAETRTAADFELQYLRIVEGYEYEAAARAA
jgi:hemerythrin-like domain-containing protein